MMYMTAKQASRIMQCTVQNVYAMISRRSLQAIRRDNRYYTTQAWIDDYYKHYRSKDYHSIYNGRRLFDEEKGIYSIQMVAKIMNTTGPTVLGWIRWGKLKSIRKGNYHVILQEDLELYMQTFGNKDIAQNA